MLLCIPRKQPHTANDLICRPSFTSKHGSSLHANLANRKWRPASNTRKRQHCFCCRAKKWTWRRNSELSLPSWQCHTCYSGLTAAVLSSLKGFLQVAGKINALSGFRSMLCLELLGGWETSWSLRPKQMDGTQREDGVACLYCSLVNPRFSDQLKTVIFSLWKSLNSVLYECSKSLFWGVFSSSQDVVVWADWASCPPRSSDRLCFVYMCCHGSYDVDFLVVCFYFVIIKL